MKVHLLPLGSLVCYNIGQLVCSPVVLVGCCVGWSYVNSGIVFLPVPPERYLARPTCEDLNGHGNEASPHKLETGDKMIQHVSVITMFQQLVHRRIPVSHVMFSPQLEISNL